MIKRSSIALLLIILMGCQQQNQMNNPQKPYSSDKAIKSGDIVSINGEMKNIDKFKAFLQNVSNKENDEIRITEYTTEGDPIFHHLLYEGNEILYTYDNSQDGYAGEDKGIRSTTCSSVKQSKNANGDEYQLNNCSSSLGDTFYLVINK